MILAGAAYCAVIVIAWQQIRFYQETSANRWLALDEAFLRIFSSVDHGPGQIDCSSLVASHSQELSLKGKSGGLLLKRSMWRVVSGPLIESP